MPTVSARAPAKVRGGPTPSEARSGGGAPERGSRVSPVWLEASTRPIGAMVQPKLTVGASDDPLELEADRVAERVMRMPDPANTEGAAPEIRRTSSPGAGVVQRACADCDEEESPPDGVLQRKCASCEAEETVRAKAEPGAPQAVPHGFQSRLSTLRGGGQPLPAAERAFFEPRFGRDLGAVRVHSGSGADELARGVKARAFTHGDDIVFRSGEQSASPAGRSLLAHELTHFVQQADPGRGPAATASRGGNDAAGTIQRQLGPGGADQAFQVPDVADVAGVAGAMAVALPALRTASPFVPGLDPLLKAWELIEGVIYLWTHRDELFARLLAEIGKLVETVPALAMAKLQEVLSSLGAAAVEAGSCIVGQLWEFLKSLAQNWLEVIGSFLMDMLIVPLLWRTIPALIGNIGELIEDFKAGEWRSVTDRFVMIMTDLNSIVGVFFLWFAILTTLGLTGAGSVAPGAGNAAGAAAGLTVSEMIGIGLVISVIATELIRVGRGFDDMIKYWDDLPQRELGCRQVAEGVFALALTAALFLLGPGIQRIARSIIERAGAFVKGIGTALSREAAATMESVTPRQLAPAGGPMLGGPMLRRGFEPGVGPTARAKGPMPGVKPPAPVLEPTPTTQPSLEFQVKPDLRVALPILAEQPSRRHRGAYPICWACQLGPPAPSGIPVTNYVRVHGERDEREAAQARMALEWRKLRDPWFDPKRFHVHHVVPLFLGGPDDLTRNAITLQKNIHLRGHDVLRFQPQMLTPPPGLPPLRPDLYKHPVGTRYYLAGFKDNANQTCESVAVQTGEPPAGACP